MKAGSKKKKKAREKKKARSKVMGERGNIEKLEKVRAKMGQRQKASMTKERKRARAEDKGTVKEKNREVLMITVMVWQRWRWQEPW